MNNATSCLFFNNQNRDACSHMKYGKQHPNIPIMEKMRRTKYAQAATAAPLGSFSRVFLQRKHQTRIASYAMLISRCF
jgi:hypothetical protein